MTPKQQATKAKIRKEHIELKTFCTTNPNPKPNPKPNPNPNPKPLTLSEPYNLIRETNKESEKATYGMGKCLKTIYMIRN